jgi:hypothetical protein
VFVCDFVAPCPALSARSVLQTQRLATAVVDVLPVQFARKGILLE